MMSFNVMVVGRHGTSVCIGLVHKYVAGWKFMPHTQDGQSRRYWPTPDAALSGRIKNYTLVPHFKTPAERTHDV